MLLRTVVSLFLVCVLAVSAQAEHPRLLFSANELAALRARRLTTHGAEWDHLITMCDYLEAHPEYPADTISVWSNVRRYHEWLLDLALVELVDPSQSYDGRLWDFFFTMLRYDTWDEDPIWGGNDLVVAHFLLALSITYDWHYDTLTPAERQEFRQRMTDYVSRAFTDISWLPDSIDTADGEALRFRNNHLWINYAGVAAAAYVLEGEIDESLRQEWLERIEWGYTNVIGCLLADGSSPEGASYHTYGLASLERWVELRAHALGLDASSEYAAHPWFTNTTLYTLYSIMPGDADNYGGLGKMGDTKTYHSHSPLNTEPVLAARLQNGIAQWMSLNLDYPVDDIYQIQVWRYLWLDAAVSARAPDQLPNWHEFDDQGIFIWRSSWSNDATRFSLKSGRSLEAHAHPDHGGFILDRAGVPYIVDLGYSLRKETDEHNVLLVDDTGQVMSGEKWPEPCPSNTWGCIPHVLATGIEGEAPGSFFNITANPRPAYTNDSLTTWCREVVGLGDLFLVCDVVEADKTVDFDLLLHSYVTEEDQPTYDCDTFRLDNPWTTLGSGRWSIDTREDNPQPANLLVTDLSPVTWDATIEPSCFVPENKPPDQGGGSNSDLLEYQYGWRLRRSLRSDSGVSLFAVGFDDETSGWTLSPWAHAGAHGMEATAAGSNILAVLWPEGGSCSGSGGWDITGSMAGRRTASSTVDDPAYFGREATSISQGGITLLSATAPVSLHARMEHQPSLEKPNEATLSAKSPATVSVYCPHRPGQVLLDGVLIDFSYASGQLTFDLPEAGTFHLETSPDEDIDGLPDFWELALVESMSGESAGSILAVDPDGDVDGDGALNMQEFVAGTDAADSGSFFELAISYSNDHLLIAFDALRAEGPGYEGYTRYYDLEQKLGIGNAAWSGVPQCTDILGLNQTVVFTNAVNSPLVVHRGRARLGP